MNSGFPRSAVVSNAQHPQFHSLPQHMQVQRPPVFRRPPWEIATLLFCCQFTAGLRNVLGARLNSGTQTVHRT